MLFCIVWVNWPMAWCRHRCNFPFPRQHPMTTISSPTSGSQFCGTCETTCSTRETTKNGSHNQIIRYIIRLICHHIFSPRAKKTSLGYFPEKGHVKGPTNSSVWKRVRRLIKDNHQMYWWLTLRKRTNVPLKRARFKRKGSSSDHNLWLSHDRTKTSWRFFPTQLENVRHKLKWVHLPQIGIKIWKIKKYETTTSKTPHLSLLKRIAR